MNFLKETAFWIAVALGMMLLSSVFGNDSHNDGPYEECDVVYYYSGPRCE